MLKICFNTELSEPLLYNSKIQFTHCRFEKNRERYERLENSTESVRMRGASRWEVKDFLYFFPPDA